MLDPLPPLSDGRGDVGAALKYPPEGSPQLRYFPDMIAPESGRGVVFLNLFFLLSIILLPVTNGLYGAYRLDGVLAVLYGVHLTIIATLNAVLWVLALRGRSDPHLLATTLSPVFVFVLGTLVALFSPQVAQFVWCLAFLAPLAGRIAAWRFSTG